MIKHGFKVEYKNNLLILNMFFFLKKNLYRLCDM